MRIQIERQVQKPGESDLRMAGGKRLGRRPDALWIARTHIDRVHDGLKAPPSFSTVRHHRLTDTQEMRSKSSDRLLQHDLEKGARDHGAGEPQDGAGGIVEAPDSGGDLEEEDGGDGDEGGEEAGCSGREDRG